MSPPGNGGAGVASAGAGLSSYVHIRVAPDPGRFALRANAAGIDDLASKDFISRCQPGAAVGASGIYLVFATPENYLSRFILQ
jgi:hypothetical protein